ncbi:putative membrane protein YczE [Clostridiales Family XIII bacterium PM5-7]
MIKQYCVRTIRVLFGLFLYALGIYLTVQANIGLAPWDAFAQGLSFLTGIQLGTMITLSGMVILVIVMLLKEKVGIGTILNTVLIGIFVNLLNWMKLMPKLDSFALGIVFLLVGQIVICFGSYFYISPGLGCGPRDSLMIAVGKRLTKVPIGAVRMGIEATALLVGFLLGAKVGIGTVIAVLSIGFILQGVFYILRFDAKAVVHESLIDTWKILKKEKHL